MEADDFKATDTDVSYEFESWGAKAFSDSLGFLHITPELVKHSLLRANYFPSFNSSYPELPPLFSTESLTPEIADKIASKAQISNQRKRNGYSSVEYITTKFDGHSRPLQIPHPLPYIHMVNTIASNWEHLKHLSANTNSALRPMLTRNGKIFASTYSRSSFDDREWIKQNSDNAQYVLHLDIRNYFPSIYTHSLTWVEHGKEIGKLAKNRPGNRGILENHYSIEFDENAMAMNQKQTSGLLVSPGASNILAEYLAESIDQKLRKKYGSRFRRYIDDYKFLATDKFEADQFRIDLEEELRTFNLSLNAHKTQLIDIRMGSTNPWLDDLLLRSEGLRPTPARLENLWNFIQHTAVQQSDMRILRYGMTLVTNKALELDSQQFAQEFLVSCALRHPYLTPGLGKISSEQFSHRNLERLAKFFVTSFRTLYSDSKAWILYTLLSNGHFNKEVLQLSLKYGDTISKTILYQYHPESSPFLKQHVSTNRQSNYGADEVWILAYQMYLNGDITGDAEGMFKILKSNNVSFLKAN